MTAPETRLALALYGWATDHPLVRALTVFAAQRLVFLIPLVLLAAWWWPAAGRPARRRVLVAAGVSALLNGLALPALGRLAARPRPFVALGLPPLFPHAAERSFPSDHTLLGVALAAPLVWRLWRLGLPLLLVALAVGLARVAAGVHWPSDILGSAAVALALGALALPLARLLLARLPAPLQRMLGLAEPPRGAGWASIRIAR